MEDNTSEIRVQFFTKNAKYAVTDTPIALPGSLRRAQLSQTINHLLQLGRPIPFDFLIDGRFLRTSLASYLEDHSLSAEEIVRVEYIIAAAPPEPPTDYKHDDWVASVYGCRAELFLTGSYDSLVRVWSSSADVVAVGAAHERPVTVVRSVKRGDGDETACVSASQDETLRLWQIPALLPPTGSSDTARAVQLQSSIVFRGHTAAVSAVAVQPTGNMVCSGSWDRSLKVWSTEPAEDDEADEAVASNKQKKSRRSSDAPKTVVKEALNTFVGSKGYISSVAWPELGVLYSAGEDHCLRTWDVQTGANTHTLTGPKAINCISYSALNNLVASADFDGKVRVYDPKSTAGVVVKAALASHRAPATSVAWSPASPYLLVSGSHDSSPDNLKMWDIRSVGIPLHNISAHVQRVLTVAWPLEHLILSGGADNTLKVHQLSAVA